MMKDCQVRLKAKLLAGAVSLLSFPSLGHAQTVSEESSSNTTLGEIIVTAQRREQSVSDIPLAVSAIGGDDLRAGGIKDVGDLTSSVPNMSLISFFPSRPEIAIRGVAMSESFLSTDQQPVGVYHDEVFQGSRAVHMSQIFDLDRVEVVRGPQGILFGRNTTAGALSFYSHKPVSNFGGYLQGTVGNFGVKEMEGALNLPLGSGVNARFSGLARSSDGWAKNIFTNKKILSYDSVALRGIVSFEIGGTEWTANLHYSHYDGDMNYYFLRGYTSSLNYDETSQRQQEAPEKTKAFGTSLTGKISLGDVDLTSITAYERSDYFGVEDFEWGPTSIQNAGGFAQFNGFAIGYDDKFYQVSQELRAAGSSGSLDWIAGVFGYYENVDSIYSDGGFGRSGIGLDFNGNGVIDQPAEGFFQEDDRRVWNQKTKEVAGFVNLNYELSSKFSVLGGLRYTYSKKELDWTYFDEFTGTPYVPLTHLEKGWSALSARVGLEYRPGDDILLYGRYDRGFKSGGFNVGGASPAELITVDPEHVNSFELGGKFTMLSGKAQLNAALFHNTISDYQANGEVISASGLAFAFQNAATVMTKGLELELKVTPARGLNLYGNFGYTDAVFSEFKDTVRNRDWSGNRVPGVPKYTVSVGGSYDFALANDWTVTPAVDFAYQSEMEGRHFNTPSEVLGARNLLDARLRIAGPNDAFFVQFWGKNLLDQEYLVKVLDDPNGGTPFAGGITEKRGMPRSYGMSVGIKF